MSLFPVLTILSKELTNREEGPKGKHYDKLVQLCTYWNTIPSLFELQGVVRQGDRAQHDSGDIEIWKGIYINKVVVLKVPRSMPQDQPYDGVSAGLYSQSLRSITDPKAVQPVSALYNPK